MPWHDLCAVIAPYYPQGENGRPPVGFSSMLRIYFLQQWFNLSDPGAEEALYESVSMCRFVGIDLGREPVRTKRLYSSSAISLRSTISGKSFSGRSTGIWSPKASRSPQALLSMLPSSVPLHPPRTRIRPGTPTCTRPRRATNGTSG